MDPLKRKVQGALNNFHNQIANNVVQKIGQSPVGRGLVNTQSFLEGNKPISIPQLNKGAASMKIGTIPFTNKPVTAGQAWDFGRSMINPALNLGYGTATDIGTNIGKTISGQPLKQYKDLKSPFVKAGYQISNLAQPGNAAGYNPKMSAQEILGNAGEIGEGLLTAYGGGRVLSMGKGVPAMVQRTATQNILRGAKVGGVIGGGYGVSAGLNQGRNETLPKQLLQAVESGAFGAGAGAVLGGGASALGSVISKVNAAVQKANPQMTPKEVKKASVIYIRDRLGRYAGVEDIKNTFIPAGGNGKAKSLKSGSIKITEGGKTVGWMDRVDNELNIDPEARASLGLSVRTITSKERAKGAEAGLYDTGKPIESIQHAGLNLGDVKQVNNFLKTKGVVVENAGKDTATIKIPQKVVDELGLNKNGMTLKNGYYQIDRPGALFNIHGDQTTLAQVIQAKEAKIAELKHNQSIGAGMTPEEARANFQKSWNETYGNRPATINTKEPRVAQQPVSDMAKTAEGYRIKRPDLKGKLSAEDALHQAGLDSGWGGLTKGSEKLEELTASQKKYLGDSARSYFLAGDPVVKSRAEFYVKKAQQPTVTAEINAGRKAGLSNTLYHGGSSTDLAVRPGKGNLGEGVYLTKNVGEARNYAAGGAGGVDINEYDAIQPNQIKKVELLTKKIFKSDKDLSAQEVAALKKKGYDGVETPFETLVFDPKKVKVTGNPTPEEFAVTNSVDLTQKPAPLRAKGKNNYTNVKAADNPLAGNPEPLPWEQQREVIAKEMNLKPFNQQEVDQAIVSDLTTKKTLKGKINPIHDLSPDLQKATREYRAGELMAQADADKVAASFKSELAPDLEYKLIKYSQDPTAKTARALGLSPQDIAKGQAIIEQSRSFNDDLFNRARAAGIDVDYLKNHILQAFKQSNEEIDDLLRAKGLSGKPGFSKSRKIESFQKGEEIGLTPKYTTFSQLNALAEHQLQKAINNKNYFQKLIDSGQILPSNTPNLPSSWKAIDAPFFPQAARQFGDGQTVITTYKAPKEIANLLNNVFGTERTGPGATALRIGAKISGGMQDVVLSGGVGPFNFFGIGQLIKEGTSGRVLKPLQAFGRAYIPGASQKFQQANNATIKEMASQGIQTGRIANYQSLYKNVADNESLSKILGKGWSKVINEPTFGKFMAELQIQFFKDTKMAALKRGMTNDEAIKLAGKATKNFYGLGDDIGRSKEFENAISSVFLAPKYRESLINIYGNLFKAFKPGNITKEEYRGVQKLAVGMAITLGMYNVAQMKLTGKPMWDNPPGKELELVVPVGDPKDKKFISFPFMPGFTAMPRRVLGAGAALVKGDPKEAAGQLSSLLSIPAGMAGELYRNKDYFGNEIIGDSGERSVKLFGQERTYQGGPITDLALYGIKKGLPGYGRAAVDVATGKSTPAFGVLQALEMPIRKGTLPNPYFTAVDEELKALPKEKRTNAEYLVKSDKNGGPDSDTEAKMLLGDEDLFNFKKNIALKTDPNDPLYSRPDSEIKAYLAYRVSEDTKIKAQIRLQNPWIPQVQYAISNNYYNTQQDKVTPTPGYNPNSIQGRLGTLLNPAKPYDTSDLIDKPVLNPMQQLTEEQVKIVSAYTAAEKGSPARKALLAANPWLKEYWEANSIYYENNPIEQKGPLADYLRSAGIDPESAFASSSGYGSGNKGVAKVTARKAPAFKAKKAPKLKFKKVAKAKKVPQLKIKTYKIPKKPKLA